MHMLPAFVCIGLIITADVRANQLQLPYSQHAQTLKLDSFYCWFETDIVSSFANSVKPTPVNGHHFALAKWVLL